MGNVHTVYVIGKVGQKHESLAAVEIKTDGADWDDTIHMRRTKEVMRIFRQNKAKIAHELAYARTISDHEQAQNVAADRQQCRGNAIKFEGEEMNENPIYVPMYPFITTCLVRGIMADGLHYSIHLPSVRLLPWNSVPDRRSDALWTTGKTIIDVTGDQYAFWLPKRCRHSGLSKRRREIYDACQLRLINGRKYLAASGETMSRSFGVIETDNGKVASIISADAVREAWPSFLPDMPLDESDSGYEDSWGSEGSEDSGDTESDDSDLYGWTDEEEIGGNETKQHKGEKEDEKVPALRKRKRGLELTDKRILGIIEDLLESGTKKTVGYKQRSRQFRFELQRYLKLRPEQFAAKHQGAVPLLLLNLTYHKRYVKRLELHQLKELSGDQVVQVVEGVVAYNRTRRIGQAMLLDVLDISFNESVTPDHLLRILEITVLHELIIWHNPNLPLDAVRRVAEGRIGKVTSRDRFLEPLRRWTMLNKKPSCAQLPPPTAPTKIPIRQVIWMTLQTVGRRKSAVVDPLISIPPGKLSLDRLEVDTLSIMLHPARYQLSHSFKGPCAELVSFPIHDVWQPLSEIFQSIERFRQLMSKVDVVWESRHWPLAFPLMLTMGDKSEDVISSPLPAEAFSFAMWDRIGWGMLREKLLQTRGVDPIKSGEYTLIFLHETDMHRLRYGMVTRDSEEKLIVSDPAVVARAAADMVAEKEWKSGIGALPAWKSETQEQDGYGTMLLDTADVQKILDASEELVARKDELAETYKGRYWGPSDSDSESAG
ncbi:hypothetical protein F5Y10DRAFT_290025 [Nemania abortiva]|nr:hypothetical protein F5Y10DRAFT_290025 [Nemania abortiva]